MRVGPRTMEVCPDFSAAHDSAPVSEWLDQRLPPGRVPPQRRAETVVQNSIDSSMAFFFVLLPFRPGAKCLPVTRLSSMSCLSKFASWPLRHCKPASDIAIRIQEVGLAEAADPAENKHGRDCAAATHHNTTCQSSFSISSCLGLAASSKIADAVAVTSATPLFPPPPPLPPGPRLIRVHPGSPNLAGAVGVSATASRLFGGSAVAAVPGNRQRHERLWPNRCPGDFRTRDLHS